MISKSATTLPAANSNLSGWPWEDDSTDDALSADVDSPKISVITPSFNQGEFIEQTIRSVLLQKQPNLEYIIIDGGSTDESVSIIRKYEPWLSYWTSEPDRGQSHAINKGFARSTGEILCWLNSDDYYPPGTLKKVGELLGGASGNFALAGHCMKIYSDGTPPVLLEGKYEGRRRLLQFWKGYQMHQPSIFWRREVFEKVGFIDENLHLIMDFDYWARISKHYDFVNVDQVLSCCNYHEAAKTGDDYARYHGDLKKFAHRYRGSPLSMEFWRLQASMFNHFTLRPGRNRLRRALKKLIG